MPKISELDLALPAAIDRNGRLVSAAELAQTATTTRSFALLAPENRRALTIARLQAKPNLNLYAIGGGEITKELAIAEVEAGTKLGDLLMEVEGRQIAVVQRAIQRQLAQASSNQLEAG